VGEEKPGVAAGTKAHVAAVAERGQDWVESRDPATRTGVGVAWWKAFWIGIASSIIVVGASLSPGLAARRDLLRKRAQPSPAATAR
jgi:hypothetical protein